MSHVWVVIRMVPKNRVQYYQMVPKIVGVYASRGDALQVAGSLYNHYVRKVNLLEVL